MAYLAARQEGFGVKRAGVITVALAVAAFVVAFGGYVVALSMQRDTETVGQWDTLAMAEFRGRHSGTAYVVDERASQRVSAGYLFYWKAGEQEYRDIKVGDFWETQARVFTDAEKTEYQWVSVEVLGLLQAREQK